MTTAPTEFAVTGVGAVSPAGIGIDALRASLAAGRGHVGTFTCPGSAQPHRGACFAADFAAAYPAAEHAFEASRLALLEAIQSADLGERGRRQLALGSALGGIHDGATIAFDERGVAAFPTPDRLTERLAREHDLVATGGTFSATCVSANYALEHACAALSLDRADAVVVGGVDTLSPVMRAGFSTLGALAGPFAADTPTAGAGTTLSDGLVLGEAASFVVLERLRDAVARGAPIRAVLDGRGQCADAVHLTAPDERGFGMSRAIRDCLADARIGPADVDRVSVTAIDSLRYARMYDEVVDDVFGERGVERTNWEWCVGHVLAATAVFGIAYAALVFESSPGRQLALTVGFGGQNGVMSLRSPDVDRSGAGS